MAKYRKERFNEAILYLRNNEPGLVALDLSDQELSEENLFELVKAMETNTHLKKIRMNSCQINDEKVEILSKLFSIEVLSLRANKISDKGLSSLAQMTSLKELDLSSNNDNYNRNITAKGLEFFVGNTTLEQLTLSDNELNDECAKKLARSNLLRLVLSNNKLTYKGAAYLASHKKLELLDISTNKIGDAGAVALINRNQGIKQLILNNNGLSIKAIIKMKTEKLKEFDRLDVSLNPLSEDGIKLFKEKRGTLGSPSFCQRKKKNLVMGLFYSINNKFSIDEEKPSEKTPVLK